MASVAQDNGTPSTVEKGNVIKERIFNLETFLKQYITIHNELHHGDSDVKCENSIMLIKKATSRASANRSKINALKEKLDRMPNFSRIRDLENTITEKHKVLEELQQSLESINSLNAKQSDILSLHDDDATIIKEKVNTVTEECKKIKGENNKIRTSNAELESQIYKLNQIKTKREHMINKAAHEGETGRITSRKGASKQAQFSECEGEEELKEIKARILYEAEVRYKNIVTDIDFMKEAIEVDQLTLQKSIHVYDVHAAQCEHLERIVKMLNKKYPNKK